MRFLGCLGMLFGVCLVFQFVGDWVNLEHLNWDALYFGTIAILVGIAWVSLGNGRVRQREICAKLKKIEKLIQPTAAKTAEGAAEESVDALRQQGVIDPKANVSDDDIERLIEKVQ